ncbi:hypothetical protein [Salinispora arenicola]|uniref:hypothetical protein n=1 Tax=Salinispora arenicola TaxID=168697 RepID=UPI00035D251F|nr:hypothetical protein [Salinispora arenicola]
MADDNPPADQRAHPERPHQQAYPDRQAHPDPHGAPPLPDGDRVRPRPHTMSAAPARPAPPATRPTAIAALVLVIVVAAIMIRVLR